MNIWPYLGPKYYRFLKINSNSAFQNQVKETSSFKTEEK